MQIITYEVEKDLKAKGIPAGPESNMALLAGERFLVCLDTSK